MIVTVKLTSLSTKDLRTRGVHAAKTRYSGTYSGVEQTWALTGVTEAELASGELAGWNLTVLRVTGRPVVEEIAPIVEEIAAEPAVEIVAAAPTTASADGEAVTIEYGVGIKDTESHNWRGEMVTITLAPDGSHQEVGRTPCGYQDGWYARVAGGGTAQPTLAQQAAVARWAFAKERPTGMHGPSMPLKLWAGLGDVAEAIRLSNTERPTYLS